jgi:hypothetical protein
MLGALELVEDVTVSVQRHRRRVAELTRDLDDSRAFVD